MSVYIQEVLGLLKRNKKKRKLDKIKDHFEFGKLYQNSSINTGAAYNPKMEPFVVNFGDLVCEITEDLTRTQIGSGNVGFVPVYTTPEGSCAWDTLMDSIITQNAIGDTITINNGNLQVDLNANVNLQLTAGSANILDLTEDRIVIVGPNGELEDDANFTFDGTEFNIGQGNFTVQVGTGNTQIVGTLDVDGQATLASANVEDLTDNRIVIVGVNGELEDDSNFTMDGVTFTANVNVQHGSITLAPVPPTTTTINSNTVLNGPITDSQGNVGQLSQILVGLGDGRVIWSDDDVVEALTYGSLWQGNANNLKQELAIGTVDQILISDGTTFSWEDNPAAIVGEVCDVFRLPLWTPDSNTLGCSILIQDGNSTTPATKVTVEGETIVEGDLHVETNTFLEGAVEVNGTTKLDTLAQDDTLAQVLVRDTSNDNLLKWRDASSIKPQVGFDTLSMLPDGWASADGNFNAYVNLDDSTTAFKSIKDMDWLVDGDRVVVIAQNTKQGSLLADNVIRFPSFVNVGDFSQVDSWTTWNQASIGSGWTGAIDNGYETSTLLFGEKIKFKAELYESSETIGELNWDACCKIYSRNNCPIVSNINITTDEDVPFSGVLAANDDGYGGYGNIFTIITQPTNGTITLNASTGAYTYTPNTNFSGSDQFTYTANDTYCTSNTAAATITVSPIPEPPVWVSIDPVTSGSWNQSNLIGGTTLPTYTWEVDDPDHACTELTYSMTATDDQGNPATWLTFTPNNPGDCGGTLTGTYPLSGGTFQVSLTVTDPDGQIATQSFPIAGVVPDNDTYILIWLDGSGSMDTTATSVSAAASVAQTVGVVFTGSVTNSVTLTEFPSIQPSGFRGYFVDDVANADQVFGGCYSINVGMRVLTLSSPGAVPVDTLLTVTTTTFNAVGATIGLSGTLAVGAQDLLVFESTAAMRTTDYTDINTLRNLLQDFYATGLTEGQGNTDSATNGSDRYGSHVKFGWMRDGANQNGEDQIRGMGNYGNQTTPAEWTTALSSGGQLEFASSVVSISFADESGVYVGNVTATTDGDNAQSGLIAADIQRVKDWVGDGISAGQSVNDPQGNALNTSVLGVFNYITAVQYNGLDIIVQGLQNGMTNSSFQAGGSVTNWSNVNLQMGSGTGGANNIAMSPNNFDFTGINNTVPQNNTAGTAAGAGGIVYKNLIQTNLQNLGFTNI